MPNHVESSLDIKGPVEDIEKLLEFIKGKDQWGHPSLFNFHAVIPMPKEIVEANRKDQKDDRWYHWSVENWGTKWGAYSVSVYRKLPTNSLRFIQTISKKNPKGAARILFQTAWSPATPVIQKLTKMFPSLTVSYAYVDEGGGFASLEKWKDGQLVENKEVDYRKLQRSLLRTIMKRLRELPDIKPERLEE